MSISEPTVGTRINLGDAKMAAAGTCNSAVSVAQWQVVAVGNQLQAYAQVTPTSSSDTVVALMVGATNPSTHQTKCGANVNVFGGSGAAGATVACLAFTDTYDPQVDGTTFTGVVSGYLLQDGGTCWFNFSQTFTVG